MLDKRTMSDKLYDMKFRTQVPVDSVIAETGRWLKNSTRDEEKQKLQRALRSFWGPFAYKDRPELREVALESILELTDQILQIALLSGLPIDQLNFKTQVLTIMQQRAKEGVERTEERPSTPTPVSQKNGVTVQQESVQPQKEVAKKRKTMFED